METRSHHNHNQAEYHTEVDRLPDDAIFPITTPIMGAVQRLDLVPLRSGNNLLLDPSQHPAYRPHPKRGRLVLIPTVSNPAHDTP